MLRGRICSGIFPELKIYVRLEFACDNESSNLQPLTSSSQLRVSCRWVQCCITSSSLSAVAVLLYLLAVQSLSDKHLPPPPLDSLKYVPTSHRIEPDSSKKDHQQGLLPILCVLCVSLAHPCLTVHLVPTASQGAPPSPWRILPMPRSLSIFFGAGPGRSSHDELDTVFIQYGIIVQTR